MVFLRIAYIAVCGYVCGAAVFFVVMSGPPALAALPLLALFGWFYIVPLVLCVWLLWAAYRPPIIGALGKVLFTPAAAISGCLVMVAIGTKGPEPRWYWAYAAAGATTGALCAALVMAIKPTGGAKKVPGTKFGKSAKDSSR